MLTLATAGGNSWGLKVLYAESRGALRLKALQIRVVRSNQKPKKCKPKCATMQQKLQYTEGREKNTRSDLWSPVLGLVSLHTSGVMSQAPGSTTSSCPENQIVEVNPDPRLCPCQLSIASSATPGQPLRNV